MSGGARFVPYRSRSTEYVGLREYDGYRLRCYEIVHGEGPLRRARFEPGIRLAVESLPRPPVDGGRPGVGFLISHQGATADYLVLCWWDNENELPTRVLVRGAAGWRPAEGRESFCVWDLEIMWRERERYVAAVLGGPAAPGLDAYLWGETTTAAGE